MRYELRTSSPIDLDAPSLCACLSIVRSGSAVDILDREFLQAQLVTVVRAEGRIIATGAIKRKRPAYARKVSKNAKFHFDEKMSEIGYIARDGQHKGHSLSRRIVAALLSNFGAGELFATTSHAKIKDVLGSFGFERKGQEWVGNRGDRLSLWIKSQ